MSHKPLSQHFKKVGTNTSHPMTPTIQEVTSRCGTLLMTKVIKAAELSFVGIYFYFSFLGLTDRTWPLGRNQSPQDLSVARDKRKIICK